MTHIDTEPAPLASAGGDATHPTQAGHDYFGSRAAGALVQALLTYTASA